MTEVTKWSAAETAANIRKGAISVTDVTKAHLARIAAVNPSINAVTVVPDDALTQAAAMDAAGLPDTVPPLYGVPVTTKINVDQAGQINSNGIPDFAGNLCTKDSAVVGNLKSAGAVVVGRTNTPEFSMRWCTSNPLHGVSLNPWNAAITPGGSSGAAAAAVASGIGTIAHGNDLGGSLRYPAFCCGVATIKPSVGRIPAFNPGAAVERPPITQTMSVQGPIARSIGDVRLGLAAMARQSHDDPMWVPAPPQPDKTTFKVGYCHAPFATGPDPAIAGAMDDAIAALKAAGVEMVEMDAPRADECAKLWGDLLFTEGSVMMRPMVDQHGSDEMKAVIDAYSTAYDLLDMAGVMEGLRERIILQRIWAQLFADIDAFLMPVSLIPPFENDLDFKDPSKVPGILTAQQPLFLVNILGLPAAAIPTGLADGIPVGVQLIGAMHSDYRVLDIAEKAEAELGRIVTELQI